MTELSAHPIDTAATLLDGVTPQALPAGMQWRQTDDGFAMKMTLYFPAAAPPDMLEDHSRHYAIEFSRWITMAYQAGPNRTGGPTGMTSVAGIEP